MGVFLKKDLEYSIENLDSIYICVLAHSNFAKIRNIFRLHISQATAIIFVLLQWRGERRVAV